MADWLKLALYVIVVEMVISWLVAARYLYVVGAELRRARKSGEAGYIPPSYRGPPLVVVFAKGILPRVETQRRRLVVALGFFAGGWVALALVGSWLKVS